MNIEARKLTIIEKFIHIKNVEIITQFENILAEIKETNQENKNFKPFTVDELKSRIKKSMIDSKKGRLISNDDLKSEIKKWS